MEQLWAITASDGSYTLRWTDGTHPKDCGHADECQGRLVTALTRQPQTALGETVDRVSGQIVFQPSLVRETLIAEIKAEVGRRIEAAVPLWKQINDLHEPPSVGRTQRRQLVDDLREWSNNLEEIAVQAISVADVQLIRSELS
jgi:hypothetical protein